MWERVLRARERPEVENPMKRRHTAAAVALILMLTGCSSRPREFVPTLKMAPADQAKYERDYETCRTLVAKGQRSGFGSRAASAGAGVAAGVGIPVGIATLGEAAAFAVASSAIVLMPVVGVGAAWAMAKRKKNRKERDIKQAIALCLSEHGYVVVDWELGKKRARAEAHTAAAARRAEASGTDRATVSEPNPPR